MIKVKCFVLILVLISSLFSDNLFPKSKWLISNEYVQKNNIYFYDDYGISDNNKSKFPLYLIEFLYASGGSCVGSLGLVFFWFTMPACAAYGTRMAARKWSTEPEGKFWCSFLGAICGSTAGAGFGLGLGKIYEWCFDSDPRFSDLGDDIIFASLIAIPAFLGNSIGAVIGYNLSLPKGEDAGFSYRHFDPPSFSMKTEKTEEGKTITAVDFRLINARF